MAVFLYFSFQLFCLEQANGFSHHQGEHSTRHLSVSGPRGRWRVARRRLFCQRACEGAARRSHLQLRVSPPGRYDRKPLSLTHTHIYSRWRFSFRNTTADWFWLYKLFYRFLTVFTEGSRCWPSWCSIDRFMFLQGTQKFEKKNAFDKAADYKYGANKGGPDLGFWTKMMAKATCEATGWCFASFVSKHRQCSKQFCKFFVWCWECCYFQPSSGLKLLFQSFVLTLTLKCHSVQCKWLLKQALISVELPQPLLSVTNVTDFISSPLQEELRVQLIYDSLLKYNKNNKTHHSASVLNAAKLYYKMNDDIITLLFSISKSCYTFTVLKYGPCAFFVSQSSHPFSVHTFWLMGCQLLWVPTGGKKPFPLFSLAKIISVAILRGQHIFLTR